ERTCGMSNRDCSAAKEDLSRNLSSSNGKSPRFGYTLVRIDCFGYGMIDRLYVHNFRCLENFTLDLAGLPSAVLIGKNGAGKSTVLACLELFQTICRGAGRVGTLISTSDFTQYRADQPMRFEVELTIGGK